MLDGVTHGRGPLGAQRDSMGGGTLGSPRHPMGGVPDPPWEGNPSGNPRTPMGGDPWGPPLGAQQLSN